MEDLAIIILAAGKGSRMKSDLAKVLHPVAGKSMVVHVAGCAKKVTKDVHVVVGHQAQQVKDEVSRFFQVSFALQEQLLGTGDAVKSALPGLASHIQNVLVLCGDVPLIQTETLESLIKAHGESRANLSVLAVTLKDPNGYGRIVFDTSGRLTAIREEGDANDAELMINLVNSGIYCFDKTFLKTAIEKIGNDNSQAEYYLTDLVEIAVAQNEKTCVLSLDDPGQVIGVNTLKDLARAEALFQSSVGESSVIHK